MWPATRGRSGRTRRALRSIRRSLRITTGWSRRRVTAFSSSSAVRLMRCAARLRSRRNAQRSSGLDGRRYQLEPRAHPVGQWRYSSTLCYFEPCRDIDPVAIDVASIPDDVADVDPHAELNAAIRRYIGVSLRHLALHFDGTTHRVDDASELEEQSVACRLNDPTAMFLDFGVGYLAPKRF